MAPESKEWGKVPGAGSLPSLWSKEVKTQLILDAKIIDCSNISTQPGLWSKEVKTQLILDAKIIDCSNISTLALILWAWI